MQLDLGLKEQSGRRRQNPQGPVKTSSVQCDTCKAEAFSHHPRIERSCPNSRQRLPFFGPRRALQNDADALRAARDSERAAKISFDLARRQMQTGNANVLLLLTGQTTYLQAVTQVVQARSTRLADTAALFAALGGGRWNRTAPLPERPSMPAPAKRDPSSNATADCSRSSSRISRISALWLGSCRGTIDELEIGRALGSRP
jgi:hypothetical protein